MMFDRVATKKQAKLLLRQGNPPMWQITLVYLIATTWLSMVVNLILPNPFEKALAVYTNMAAMMSNYSGSSDAFVSLMQQQVLQCFQGTTAAIAMLVALLVLFYSLVVELGYLGAALRTMRGQGADFRDLFSHFDLAGKMILLAILKSVFVYLWSLLFVIPGIVALYRYRQAEYCLLDEPDISALEAIRRSKALMKGNKGQLFVLDLSFIGWFLLQGLITTCFYNGFSAVVSATAADWISTAISTAVSLFVLTYYELTCAGFYAHLVDVQAPPVNEPTGGNGQPFEVHDYTVNNDDEGWNL